MWQAQRLQQIWLNLAKTGLHQKLGMTYENACCEKPTFISTKPDFEEHISDGHIFKFSWIRSAFGICRFGDVTFPQRLKRTFHANISSQIILWMLKNFKGRRADICSSPLKNSLGRMYVVQTVKRCFHIFLHIFF